MMDLTMVTSNKEGEENVHMQAEIIETERISGKQTNFLTCCKVDVNSIVLSPVHNTWFMVTLIYGYRVDLCTARS